MLLQVQSPCALHPRMLSVRMWPECRQLAVQQPRGSPLSLDCSREEPACCVCEEYAAAAQPQPLTSCPLIR